MILGGWGRWTSPTSLTFFRPELKNLLTVKAKDQKCSLEEMTQNQVNSKRMKRLYLSPTYFMSSTPVY